MKKILVLTDLSENSSYLTEAAVMLSEKLHADILLFNNYETIPVTPFYGAGPWIGQDESWWEQESRNKLDVIAGQLRHKVDRLLPEEQWKPAVSTQCLPGGLAENVKNIITHQDIELVIMGSSKGTRFEHMLFVNATKSVVAHATRPVIIVPSGAGLTDIGKVIFATDFESGDIRAVSYLARLGQLLHYELEIVHVGLFGEKESETMQEKKVFMAMLEDLRYPMLRHSEVRGKEVVSRLIKLCSEKKADLLGLLHKHDSLLVRMIRQSTTNRALENHTFPMIVFPSKMS